MTEHEEDFENDLQTSKHANKDTKLNSGCS